MKKLLITGFQPFDGESVNPALEVAKGLQGKTINGYEVIAREIPVVRFEALKAVQAAIEELQPNAVITIGQAGGRPDITVERVGINIDDFRIPDNKGNQPIDEPVVAGGPVAYWATLPIKKNGRERQGAGYPGQRLQLGWHLRLQPPALRPAALPHHARQNGHPRRLHPHPLPAGTNGGA